MTDTYSSANSEQASSSSGMSEFGDDPSWNAPIQEGQSTTHSHSSSTTTADDTASSPNNNQQADSSSLSSDKDQHTAVRFETMVFRPTDHFSPATQNGTREPERIEVGSLNSRPKALPSHITLVKIGQKDLARSSRVCRHSSRNCDRSLASREGAWRTYQNL